MTPEEAETRICAIVREIDAARLMDVSPEKIKGLVLGLEAKILELKLVTGVRHITGTYGNSGG